jgi:murein DD-endopeptidase MepM/ murein hydrolase activator NlpD
VRKIVGICLVFFCLFFMQPTQTSAKERLVLACPQNVALGQAFLVRLTSQKVLEDVRVFWLDKKMAPSVSRWDGQYVALVLLGTDVLFSKPAVKKLRLEAMVGGERKIFIRTIRIYGKKYFAQQLTLPPQMVTPSEEVMGRIAEERKLIDKALKTVTPERLWQIPFLRPVPGKVTSIYGLRRILNGKPRNPHRGLDFSAPTGTQIKAACDGRVALVGDHYYAGKSVYLDHGLGVYTVYFHLSEIKIKEGEFVKRGSVIGLSGMTGRATGPHLHLGVTILQQAVDPLPLIEENVDSLLK